MKKIYLFSDGSSLGNPGFGGYCGILRYGDSEKVVSGSVPNATNNQMELLAVIESLRAIKEPCEVHVVSDSSYVVKGINEWLVGWEKRNFAKVKNPNMWRDYLSVAKTHKVTAEWVKGHAGHEENEKCDQIARGEAEKLKEGNI